MTSRVMTRCCVTFCTSTAGASPVTVMVSSSAPTRMSALTVAVNAGGQLDALASHRAEPGSVNVTE